MFTPGNGGNVPREKTLLGKGGPVRQKQRSPEARGLQVPGNSALWDTPPSTELRGKSRVRSKFSRSVRCTVYFHCRYQKAWRDYVKFRHLLANMSKPTFEDKRKLEAKENKLQEMRTQSKMKRDVTVAVSAKGFYRTGIMCDVIQVSRNVFIKLFPI